MYILIIIVLIILIILFKNKENFNINDSKQFIANTYKLSNISASELINTDTLDTDNFSAENFIGIIVAWSGSIDTIPPGWALCDGSTYKDPNNNDILSPDLRSRFILGASPGRTSPIMVKLDGNSDTTIITNNDVSNNVIFLTPVNINTKGGEEKHALTYQELPSHTHDIPVVAYGNKYCDIFPFGAGCIDNGRRCNRSLAGSDSVFKLGISAREGSGYANSYTGLDQSGESKPHENLHPYYTLAFIIKIS